MLAALLLSIHVAIIAFNLFGLFAIPIGARRGWAFVRRPGWRLLHLASLAIVALQAALGRACFLTIWQDAAAGTATETPLIMRTVDALIYWRLPIWVFAAAYLAIFLYVIALWWLVPVRWSKG